jgi:hypothetical protein
MRWEINMGRYSVKKWKAYDAASFFYGVYIVSVYDRYSGRSATGRGQSYSEALDNAHEKLRGC